MSNAVLDRLTSERSAQVAFIDGFWRRVEAEGRDLVDAEWPTISPPTGSGLPLDSQIAPIAEFERSGGPLESPAPITARVRRTEAVTEDRVQYAPAGSFVVDLLSARGYMQDRRTGRRLPPIPRPNGGSPTPSRTRQRPTPPASCRIPIVGQVVSLIDATRPFITSIGGGRPMGGFRVRHSAARK